MNGTYRNQVVLQVEVSDKLNGLRRQASTQRLISEAYRQKRQGRQFWQGVRRQMAALLHVQASHPAA